MEIKLNYVALILTVLLLILKLRFSEGIANDVERLFDTSNYDEKDNRPLPTGKNKKVIGLFKDELSGKIVTEFVALRAKACEYLLNDYNDDDYDKNKMINKNVKGTKKCIIKCEFMFKNYKDSLFNDEIILKLQQRFKSDLRCIQKKSIRLR